MTDDDSTVSLIDKDEFEKFMQESLSSSDVPSSVGSIKSDETKPYQMWWGDGSKSPTARPTATSSWLKKTPAKALGDSKTVTSIVSSGVNISREPKVAAHNVEEDSSSTIEQDESDKESHYSDTFESASSTASREVEQGDTKDTTASIGEQVGEKPPVIISDAKLSEEQNLSVLSKGVHGSQSALQSDSPNESSPSHREVHHDHSFQAHERADTGDQPSGTTVAINQTEELQSQLDEYKKMLEHEISENKKLKDIAKTANEREAKLSTQLDESKKLLELEKLETKMLKDKIHSTNTIEEDLTNKLSEYSEKLEFEQQERLRLKGLLETSETELSEKLLDQLETEQASAALQKENILLLAKIEELELKGRQSTNGIINSENIGVLKEQVIQLQKEIQDQEALLVGYQKENERLYSELKNVQKGWKVTEGKLKTHNQQLTGEVTRLREQIQVMDRAKNFKLNTEDSKKEELSPHGSNKVTVSEDLIQKYQDEIRQLLDVTKNLEDERNTFEKVHIQDVKSMEELHRKIKEMEDKMTSNLAVLTHSTSPCKNILEHDIDAAKIKTLQNEITKLQNELKSKDQEKKDISKFYEEEYKKLKIENEKKESELRSSQMEFQPLRIKIEELHLELESAEDRNKQLAAQLQRKRQITKSSKAIQVAPAPDKKRSDVVLENKELKIKIEKLESEKRDMESNIQVIKNEIENLVAIEQREKEHQIERLNKRHTAELQKVISEMAAQHSTSKVAELMNKLQSQEILIGQIQDQTREIEEMKNRIELLQVENSDLETEIKELRADLNKTKSLQTPQMKDFLALQEEIRELEKRQHRREEELHYMTHQLKRNDYAFLKQEVIHWQNQVLEKNKELEYFRSELNTILVFLGELERQGITIPNLKSREKCTDEATSGRAKPS